MVPSRILLTASVVLLLFGSATLEACAQDRGDRESRSDGERSGRGDRGGRSFRDDFGSGSRGGFDGGGFRGGPPGRFGGGPPGGFGGGRSMLDTNGNGTIDQEELDRMPSFFRDMMATRGIELKAGMTVDDMRDTMRASFSRSRDTNDSQNNRQDGSTGNPNAVPVKPVLKPYVMKPKPALIETLPPAYSEVDTDFDGQLGLDEWMLARRADLDQFDEFDTDHDGFLIPAELKAAEVAATGSNVAMSVRTEKLTIVSAKPEIGPGSSGKTGTSGPERGNGGSRWTGRVGDVAEQAKSYIQRLDQNQDGVIDTDELQGSRRVRGMFEQAGIPLEQMSAEQFAENFRIASEASPSNGGR